MRVRPLLIKPLGDVSSFRKKCFFGSCLVNDVLVASMPPRRRKSARESNGDKTMSGTNLTDGNDTFSGNGTIYALQGDDSVTGGSGNDTIFGGAGNDTLAGGTGADLLRGGLGDDSLNGGAGEDTLRGAEGDDIIIGGGNADVIFGGDGADIIIYFTIADGADTINDWASVDQIQVSAAGFGGGLVAGADLAATGRFITVNASGGDVDATIASGQFIFDADSGNLWWDQDGTGAGKVPLLVAALLNLDGSAGTATAADVTVIA